MSKKEILICDICHEVIHDDDKHMSLSTGDTICCGEKITEDIHEGDYHLSCMILLLTRLKDGG